MSSMNKDSDHDGPTRYGVPVDEFISTTRTAIETEMSKLGSVWKTRLENYHDFLHDKAIKVGFWYGAIFSCSIILMILFFSRLVSR